jgi:hypothetical protein
MQRTAITGKSEVKETEITDFKTASKFPLTTILMINLFLTA